VKQMSFKSGVKSQGSYCHEDEICYDSFLSAVERTLYVQLCQNSLVVKNAEVDWG